MESVKRYGHIGYLATANNDLIRLYPEMDVYVLATDFDRVLSERNALQLRLNDRDDLDDQLTSLEQRRYAEQQACQAAERRVEELESLLKTVPFGLHSGSMFIDGECKCSQCEFVRAVRAALNPTAEAESHDH